MFLSVDVIQLNDGEHAFDGFEGGFDAIIVEVDWDSPSLSGLRTKRQAGFPSGIRLYIWLNKQHNSLLVCVTDPQRRSSAMCGKRSVSFEPPRPTMSNRLGRVVNGVNAPVGAYPWQVAI